MKQDQPVEIACQQVMAEDRSVSSLQWMVVPSSYALQLAPEKLLEKYFSYIRRATFGLIRPTIALHGVEFRIFYTGIGILTFHPPMAVAHDTVQSVSLAIRGGLLVQRDQCDRGQLTIASEMLGDQLKVTLLLSEYCPLILGPQRSSAFRKYLYRFTQAYIHKMVTTRFLAKVYRELAGKGACVKVVPVRSLSGEEI